MLLLRWDFISFHWGYAILSPYHLSTLMFSLCPEVYEAWLIIKQVDCLFISKVLSRWIAVDLVDWSGSQRKWTFSTTSDRSAEFPCVHHGSVALSWCNERFPWSDRWSDALIRGPSGWGQDVEIRNIIALLSPNSLHSIANLIKRWHPFNDHHVNRITDVPYLFIW